MLAPVSDGGTSYTARIPTTSNAEYFNGVGFIGDPVVRRIDHDIDFDWNGASLSKVSPAEAACSQEYELYVGGNQPSYGNAVFLPFRIEDSSQIAQ